MKKLIFATTAIVALAAGSAGAADMTTPVLKAAPKPEPDVFSVWVEYLWLRAGVGDTSFVINSPVTTTFPNGTRENNDPSAKGAYRVGAAYEFGDSHRKVEVTYTHLGQTQSKVVGGNFLWATVGRPDFASSFENFAGSASSTIGISYDRVDLLFSEPFKWNNAHLAFLYGLEYAKLGLTEDFVFAATGGPLGTVSTTAGMRGIGPQIGANLDYLLLGNPAAAPGALWFNVMSTASLLLAKLDSSASNVLNGAPLLNVTDQTTNRLIAALHMRASLVYEFPTWGYGRASLAVGYEFNTYLGAITRTLWPDDVADGLVASKYSNLDLSGPFAAFKVKF